ncbi:MAG: uncharacterized protein K0S70_5211 [Microbacterium sp.]|nr:uncharacterized protein [Microbacterium sp.]
MTLIMGVVNVTPDSFSDGGRYADADAAVAHGLRLREQGAHILDIGGESTRPGAERVGPALEQERVLPVVSALAEAGALVSIDTMNAATAVAAVAAGARIVNDVSGGMADPDMLSAVAQTDADVVLQHWRGHSAEMYARATYDDVVTEVVAELRARIAAAAAAGIPPSRVVVASRATRTGRRCGVWSGSSRWARGCCWARAASGSSPTCWPTTLRRPPRTAATWRPR